MFIRSKYENIGGEYDTDNPPTSLKNIQAINTQTKENKSGIIFHYFHDKEPVVWKYKTKEQRDSEYEWILSKLDCVVNEDDKNKNFKPLDVIPEDW